jgi:hypothetical protein
MMSTPVMSSSSAVGGSESGAWGDFGSSTPNANVPPASASNTTAGALAGSDESSWGNFNEASSHVAAAVSTPQGSQGNQSDWGDFNDSTPAPAPTPVPAGQPVHSAYNMPPTPGAVYAAHTPYAAAAHTPYYQNTPAGTPVGYANNTPGGPQVAFYNQNDKNSLYHQLKSAEKSREDRARMQREEELKKREEMLKKQEEDKKKGMFKGLSW